MKKIVLSIILTILASVVQAKEVVTIVFVGGPGDTLATPSRALADEANKIQNRYTFIFDSKPGAGGALAANYVKNTPDTILATSSAFFIRPNFYPNESYDFSDFKSLMPQCSTPIVITSKKYQSWQAIPLDSRLTVGITPGPGSTSHLAVALLAKKYKNTVVVPYKSVSESFIAMAGEYIDADAGFLGTIESWDTNKSKSKISILGITGHNSYNGRYPLLVNQGFSNELEHINLTLHLVVSNQTSAEKIKEWQTILAQASNTKAVKGAYALNYCTSLDQMPSDNIQPWFSAQISRWKKFTNGISINGL